jgi:2-dehydropantoate 2-reductase
MSTSPAVEFTVLGAGAIGSILSAHLACAGRSVAVLARGQRAQQIQREGLRITGLAEISTPVPVLTDPSQLRETQVLIVATKASGTAAALQALRHIKVGTAFSIQNGLLKNELLAETFGQERVLGALANISGELRASGEVQLTRNVNVLVGVTRGRTEPACAADRADRRRFRGPRDCRAGHCCAGVEQIRELGGTRVHVADDALGDVALPQRCRLRAGAGPASA